MFAQGGFVSLLLVIAASPAAASTLSGSTICGSNVMVGATVRAILDSNQSDAGTSTTDGAGQYSLTLADGRYDLVVTPPSGSLCVTTTIQNKNVAGNTPLDIILSPQSEPPPPGNIVFSGHVIVDGAGVQGASVLVFRFMFGPPVFYSGTTDSSGYYEIAVPVGSWEVGVGADATGTSTSLSCQVPQRDYDSSVNHEFSANTGSVTGLARDATDQAPIAGLGVSAFSSFSVGDITCSGNGSATTDGDGEWGPILVLAGASGRANTTGTSVYEPGSQGFTTPSDGTNIDVIIDVPRVPPPQFSVVSGYFLSATHGPIEGASAQIFRFFGGPPVFHTTTTDANGFWTITVPNGNWSFAIGRGAADGLPNVDCSNESIDLAGPRTLSFTLPSGSVEGSVRYADNQVPIEGASVSVSNTLAMTDATCSASRSGLVTDAQGAFGPVVLLGGGGGSANVNALAGAYDAGSSSFTVTTDATVSTVVNVPRYVPPPTYSVSGVLTVAGQPLVGASVQVVRFFGGPLQFFNGTTAADGSYNVVVSSGGDWEVAFSGSAITPLGITSTVSCSYSGIDVNPSATVDKDFSGFARLFGSVTTESSIPIAGVAVSASTYDGSGCSSSGGLTTGDDGQYEFALLTGSGNYSFTPPAGSGYKTISFNNALPGDREQQIVLQLPDIVAPTLLGQPDVIHHSNTSVSIQFTTNEATSGHVDYQLGAVLDGGATPLDAPSFTTDHIFTLVGLEPQTDYVFKVSAKDPSNNTVTSGVIPFTTFELPDAAAPVILGLPYITFLGPTEISIAWRTDEPSTSRVDYGLASGTQDLHVESAQSALLHNLTITGLTPGETYKLTVQSTDPDGNGPSFGAPLNATTPLEPDTTPPEITNLRTECVTDTAMAVCWETDEPADSALVYERTDNNLAVQLARDGLVTTRCLGLGGLSADTEYRITVSSTDGGFTVGTGGPLLATTATDASQGAPVISALTAQYDSPTLARVSWTTDIPSSSAVRWGTSPGALTGIAGDLSASEETHVVFINQLPADTPIWVAAVSTNPCHQTTTSATTLVVDVDQCAVGNGGCDQGCVERNPGFECTCDSGWVLAGDRHTCVSLGTCAGALSCDPDDGPIVFYGVVDDLEGNAVGSFRCTREVDGAIHCDTDEEGFLDVSDVLWCEP